MHVPGSYAGMELPRKTVAYSRLESSHLVVCCLDHDLCERLLISWQHSKAVPQEVQDEGKVFWIPVYETMTLRALHSQLQATSEHIAAMCHGCVELNYGTIERTSHLRVGKSEHRICIACNAAKDAAWVLYEQVLLQYFVRLDPLNRTER